MSKKNRFKKNRNVNTPAEAVEKNVKSTEATSESTKEETTPEKTVKEESPKIKEIIPIQKKAKPRISGPAKVWFRSNGTSRYFKPGEELEITSEQAQLFMDKGHGEVFEK